MTQETKPTLEEWRGERGTKRLKCATEATTYQKAHYKEVKDRVAQGEPVVWTWGAPLQIYATMDMLHMQIVNWSALLSAKQMSRYYLDILNSEGYFRDLCRYCTVPLGYAFDKNPEISPWGGLPKFTAMVGAHLDDPEWKIWELYAREFNIPIYLIDCSYMSELPHRPERYWEDLPEHYEGEVIEPHRIDVMVEEYEGLIRFLETTTGKHFSETKLRHSLDISNQENEYYWKASELEGTIPCPISWVDELSSISTAIYFPGTEVGLDFARKYYEEIKERVDKGIGVCDPERVRLWWNGHPAWFSLGFFNSWEEQYGAVFLPMRYLAMREMGIRFNLSDPLRTLATGQGLLLTGAPTLAIPQALYMARKYKAHGTVFMVVESCKLLYCTVLFRREALEKAGIPTLEINADMVDARDWDNTKMKSLVTSFIETLMA